MRIEQGSTEVFVTAVEELTLRRKEALSNLETKRGRENWEAVKRIAEQLIEIDAELDTLHFHYGGAMQPPA